MEAGTRNNFRIVSIRYSRRRQNCEPELELGKLGFQNKFSKQSFSV